MNSLLFSFPHFPFLLYTFLISVHLPLSYTNKEWYTSCRTLFNCGTMTGVSYPFWGENRPQNCGHPILQLDCDDDIPEIYIMNVNYRVLDINQDAKILKIAREDFLDDICPEEFVNTTLDSTLFDYDQGYENVTFLYGCPPNNVPINRSKFFCSINGVTFEEGYVEHGAMGPGPCHASVVVPIRGTFLDEIQDLSSLNQVVREGFEVRLKVDSVACDECKNSSGQCGYDLGINQFACFCPNDQSFGSSICTNSSTTNRWSTPRIFPAGPPGSRGPLAAPGTNRPREDVSLIVGLGIGGAALFGLGLGWFGFSYRQKKKRLAAQSVEAPETKSKDISSPLSSRGLTLTTTPSTNFSRSIPSFASSTFDHGKGSTYFGVQVFSYAELEEATDNFARTLGDGGFGTVYYGKLHDGRVIAVKRLYENNFRRVEQFMNEVEILTRLRHEHLVTLYGCTSKRSRELLLVYEYIPNGTIADHLHGKQANSGLLSWPVRLNIAIETADALAYLHASEIIHRDVKTNNVLLGNDFRVKVADFGLSRLFPTDVTHVSTAPQGTPGYVDPEYYQCYQLTTKSDVYSFGVVLVELISSKQAVDTNRHRHDINLASMAINKIQNHTLHELVDPSLGFETNSSVRRMTTLVAELAFRCLQQERDMRPTMEEVLVALRRIKNEEFNAEKAEVVDIVEDDAGILKPNSPPMSPKSVVTETLFSSSTTPNSSG